MNGYKSFSISKYGQLCVFTLEHDYAILVTYSRLEIPLVNFCLGLFLFWPLRCTYCSYTPFEKFVDGLQALSPAGKYPLQKGRKSANVRYHLNNSDSDLATITLKVHVANPASWF